MEHNCIVFGCRNSSISSQTQKYDCNFYSFPLKRPDLVNKWLKKLCLQSWTPGPENVVCEEHFSRNSFQMINNKQILKQNAVPNILNNWCHLINDDESILDDLCNDNFNEESNNLKNLRCRICAEFLAFEDAIDIYSDDENVIEKMLACIPIMVKEEDCFPKHICEFCLSDLNISYRMLVKAIESEKIFNNLLNRLPDTSDENENKETNLMKLENDETIIQTICVICNIPFENLNDLSSHFREKHVDELEFNEQGIDEEETEEMSNAENQQQNLLDFVKEKDTRNNTVNESIIELEYEVEDGQVINENFVNIKKCLKDKYENKNVENKWTCDVCSMTFISKELMELHAKNFHKSDDTGIKIEEVDNINVLNNDDEEMQYLICQICLQIFRTTDELSDHMQNHVDTLMCDTCGYSCKGYEKLMKHKDSHTKRNKNHTCMLCCTVFANETEMLQHSKEVHLLKDIKENTSAQKWICKFCGKEICTKLSLAIHERIHTGVRPYICEFCGRSFKSKANLIQHKPVHTGVKKYKCPICDKAFSRKAFVTTHMRVHTGERPYKCEICGNSYTQIGDMRRHQKRHIVLETSSINDANTDRYSNANEIKLLSDYTDNGKLISVNQPNVFESNSLIKLHFVKDVTDFRRILVELQQ